MLTGANCQESSEHRGKDTMDTLGDLLTRIRNAALARRPRVVAPWSKIGESVCRLLQKEGYLSGVEVGTTTSSTGSSFAQLELTIAYTEDGEPIVSQITRLSKPGRRQHVRSRHLPRVLQGYGLTIVSTSSGIMTGREAKEKGLGGELLCLVW